MEWIIHSNFLKRVTRDSHIPLNFVKIVWRGSYGTGFYAKVWPRHKTSIHQLRARRALSIFKDVPLRTRRAIPWVAPPKNGTVDTVDFSGLSSDQQLFFFTLLDRASFPHYNNTKIIKFGWELFILWVISYGLSFSGFARFPEFRGTINDKSMANPENDST